MALTPIKSADGSITLQNSDLNEHYHSLDGALKESFHVYIKNGLHLMPSENQDIRIFELGFGMGYNALLSLKEQIRGRRMYYFTCETYPLKIEDLKNWVAVETFPKKEDLNIFKKIHSSSWEIENQITPEFKLFKTKTSIENLDIVGLGDSFDLVYYDAFAPSRQPDVWDLKNLEKCFTLLKKDGILTTYCSQGQFKRNLLEAGFRIEKRQGFGKKREMTVAIKG